MRFLYILSALLATLAYPEVLAPWKSVAKRLSLKEQSVILDKGTERAFLGKYVNTDELGVYRCKVCNSPLYKSNDKFHSNCGWPSFDDAIKGAIKRQKDADGHRMEILCAKCNAHLGHLFEGEGLTAKNVRHCVNSISLKLDKATKPQNKKAYFAGGCFWGVEYYLEKLDGVEKVVSGYMGGKSTDPTYREVSSGNSGHLEIVEVLYDPSKISYEKLAKTFFEIHDPTQSNGQGPDIGEQYRSAIFVSDKKERETIEKLITLLKKKGYRIATKIYNSKKFYPAEAYHQDYYVRHKKKPYCHVYMKRF